MARIEIRFAKLALQKGANEGRKINISVVARETGLTRNTVADYWYDRVKAMNRDVLATLMEWLNCRFEELVVQVEDADEESGIEMRVPYSVEFAVPG